MRAEKFSRPEPDCTHKVLDVVASGALVFGVYVLVATLYAEANWSVALALTVITAAARYASRYRRASASQATRGAPPARRAVSEGRTFSG